MAEDPIVKRFRKKKKIIYFNFKTLVFCCVFQNSNQPQFVRIQNNNYGIPSAESKLNEMTLKKKFL